MKVIASDERTAVVSRVMGLLDPGSFMEMGEQVSARYTEFYHPDSVMESDGVVTGYGTINGNLVFVYAQDNEVMGGTFGEQHGRKIVDLYEHAIKAKAPVIGLLDCAGFRIEEGLDGLYQFAKLYKRQTEASHIIPQIVAVIGQCGGGMSIAAQLADFVFIEKDKGSIFVNPQRVVSNAIGDNPYVEALNDGTFEWAEIVEKIHGIVDILPSSSRFAPDILEVSDEELNRSCDGIEDSLGDARAILEELSDDGQTRFHIPLLTITDTDGYNTDSATEILLPSAAERMVRALTASDVPKINLVTGSIVGSAYSMMNSKGLGADYVFMWDTANVSIVEPRQATEVIFGKWSSELEQQFRDTQSSAVALARHGFADKVIAPEDSRKYLIGALQTFVNSR